MSSRDSSCPLTTMKSNPRHMSTDFPVGHDKPLCQMLSVSTCQRYHIMLPAEHILFEFFLAYYLQAVLDYIYHRFQLPGDHYLFPSIVSNCLHRSNAAKIFCTAYGSVGSLVELAARLTTKYSEGQDASSKTQNQRKKKRRQRCHALKTSRRGHQTEDIKPRRRLHVKDCTSKMPRPTRNSAKFHIKDSKLKTSITYM